MLAATAKRLGRYEIMVAMYVNIFLPVAYKTPGYLWMGLKTFFKLQQSFTIFASGKRFKHVPEEHDLLEIRLEVFKKAEELVIVVTETIGLIAASNVKIRYNGNVHVFNSCRDIMLKKAPEGKLSMKMASIYCLIMRCARNRIFLDIEPLLNANASN